MPASSSIPSLGLIAGKGLYPRLVLDQARKQGVGRIVVTAFEGETDPALADLADNVTWVKVGQLGKMLRFFKDEQVGHALMAGQITPKRLFDLRPDFQALVILAKLKTRNAESIFGAIADALAGQGTTLLPATTFLEDYLATPGLIAGPKPGKQLARDIEFGWPIAKQVSDLHIGQTVVVKKGTVLAVEAYEGTNDTLRRGGLLSGGPGAVVLKVSKPNQDMRFDVPVIGPDTIRIAHEAGVGAIVCEARKTLLLGLEEIRQLALSHPVTVWGHQISE